MGRRSRRLYPVSIPRIVPARETLPPKTNPRSNFNGIEKVLVTGQLFEFGLLVALAGSNFEHKIIAMLAVGGIALINSLALGASLVLRVPPSE